MTRRAYGNLSLTRQLMWAFLAVPLSVMPSARSEDKEPLTASAFIDTTIAHDFNRLPTRYRPYTTQPYYNNEGALNLGFVDAELSTERYHGRLAIQYGSSVIANYADEADEFVRYFQEAYGGIKISDTWHVDAGIYFSHIGMESWISRDDYTVGRSIICDYSPYYQSGIRSVHDISERLHIELHLLRGWQNISNNSDPSLGTQVAYDLTPRTTVVYNTFIGNEHGLRVYNDFVLRHAFSRRFGVAAAFDLGAQNRSEESRAWWYGWSIIPHYSINDTLAVAGRVEQFSDPQQVVLQSFSNEAFNATSLSANIDISLLKDLVWRSEYRAYVSSRDLFPDGGGFSTTDNVVTTSIIYTLQ